MIKNDILERLMKGEDPNKIAQEFTDALNAAIKEQEEKQEEVQKKEELQDIIDLFVEWFNKYYEVPFDRSKVTADDIIELIEGVEEAATALVNMKPLLMKTTTINPDKTIDDFLKSMKW
jgi:lipoate-protein ligase A